MEDFLLSKIISLKIVNINDKIIFRFYNAENKVRYWWNIKNVNMKIVKKKIIHFV